MQVRTKKVEYDFCACLLRTRLDLLGLKGDNPQRAAIPSHGQCVAGWVPGSTCDYLVPARHGFGRGCGGAGDANLSVDRAGGDDVRKVGVKRAGPNTVLVLYGALR